MRPVVDPYDALIGGLALGLSEHIPAAAATW
jgi:hypothetical protein